MSNIHELFRKLCVATSDGSNTLFVIHHATASQYYAELEALAAKCANADRARAEAREELQLYKDRVKELDSRIEVKDQQITRQAKQLVEMRDLLLAKDNEVACWAEKANSAQAVCNVVAGLTWGDIHEEPVEALAQVLAVWLRNHVGE